MNTKHPNNQPPLSHPWEKYLPSKKMRIILVVIIVLAILYGIKNPAISLFKKIFNKEAVPIVTIPVSQQDQEKITLSTDKDTDGDGLADWQETLIGTDPETPNTQDEVPQSFRDLLTTSTQDVVGTEDKLALKVYQRLLTDPKGDSIEEAVQAATTKELLDLADSIDMQQQTYTKNDLTIVDDTSDERSTYKQSLQRIILQLNPTDSVLESVYSGILKGEALQVPITYKTLLAADITKLLEMPVPLRLTEQHLILLNSITHAYGVAESASEQKTTDESMRFASFLVFQKNLNLSSNTIYIIFKMLSVQ